MATFYNQATLFYNGVTRTSNTTSGEIIEALAMVKTAVSDTFAAGDTIAYAISIINSGANALTDLTLTDNLGNYTSGGVSATPLTYKDGSIKYYIDGVLQAAPTVVAGPPLVISGINIPAGSDAIIIYEALVNQYAPLGENATITNTATLSGQGVTPSVTAQETVTAQSAPTLNIIKALNPTTVAEDGEITYTFTIENYGNTAATATDNVMITDTFTPPLNNISVVFNGTAWASPAQYTYNAATGDFATVAGAITVPAATYVQDPTTLLWTTIPGISTLTVSGTV